MQPATGGRFSLRLCEQDARYARYELSLAAAGAEWFAGAQVASADGQVEVGAWRGSGGEPPAWLVHYARAALRSTWYGHGERGWPRRLTRWRDAPHRGEPSARQKD